MIFLQVLLALAAIGGLISFYVAVRNEADGPTLAILLVEVSISLGFLAMTLK